MSKSILIIDTPDNCMQCPMRTIGEFCDVRCCAKDNRTLQMNEGSKETPTWCPLRMVPDKREEKRPFGQGALESFNNIIDSTFSKGFNYCIDEIMNRGE